MLVVELVTWLPSLTWMVNKECTVGHVLSYVQPYFWGSLRIRVALLFS